MASKLTYLLINFFSVIIPLLYSFEKNMSFVRKWKYLFPALALTAVFFIIWDIIFTKLAVWGFNEKYLVGIQILNLPLEEWLFFFAIPFSCVFTYQALVFYTNQKISKGLTSTITRCLILACIVLAILNPDKLYTFWTCVFTGLFLSYHQFILKQRYLGRALLAYIIILLPFFLVNGILTGSFIDEPVVWYDNTQNLGVRMFTIPIEDSIYGLLLFLMNVTLFEYFQAMGARKSVKDNLRQHSIL